MNPAAFIVGGEDAREIVSNNAGQAFFEGIPAGKQATVRVTHPDYKYATAGVKTGLEESAEISLQSSGTAVLKGRVQLELQDADVLVYIDGILHTIELQKLRAVLAVADNADEFMVLAKHMSKKA